MSRNPGAYKDLGKDANDFLNKNFLENDWKVELNSAAPNGASVKVTAGSVKTEAGTGIATSLENKRKISPTTDVTAVVENNKDFKLTLAKKKVFAGIDSSVEVSSNINKLLEGLKVKASADYLHDVATINSNLTVPLVNGATTSVSSIVLGSREQGIALGAEAELNAVRGQVTRFDTIFSYTKPSTSLSLFTRTKRDNTTNVLAHRAGFNVFHRVANSPSNVLAGLEGVYDLKTSQVNVVAAVGFKPDESSTVKTRLDNSGVLGLAYTQQFNAPLTVSTFANANLLNLEGPDAIKFGFKVNFQH